MQQKYKKLKKNQQNIHSEVTVLVSPLSYRL